MYTSLRFSYWRRQTGSKHIGEVPTGVRSDWVEHGGALRNKLPLRVCQCTMKSCSVFCTATTTCTRAFQRYAMPTYFSGKAPPWNNDTTRRARRLYADGARRDGFKVRSGYNGRTSIDAQVGVLLCYQRAAGGDNSYRRGACLCSPPRSIAHRLSLITRP